MDTHTHDGHACDCGYDDMYETVVEAVRVGMAVPDMSCQVYDPKTGKDRTMHISEHRGQWLILFFYPADFTFVCPTELADMAAHAEDFAKEGATIVSVSSDSVFTHKAWHETSDAVKTVTFAMAGDTTHEFAETFGVDGEDGLPLRGSFIIDPEGVLRVAHVHSPGIGRNATELLRILRAAKFVHEHGDKVCPANWEPGKDTLTPGMDLVGKI